MAGRTVENLHGGAQRRDQLILTANTFLIAVSVLPFDWET